MDLSSPVIIDFLTKILVLVIAITLHEFGHAIAANAMGDSTPKRQGRISINPLDHLDPMGTLAMALSSWWGFGIGWGRPVLTNPNMYTNKRLGVILVALAGPTVNILIAILFGTILRFNLFHLSYGSPYTQVMYTAFGINIVLFCFNLIPVPPLDGSHILAYVLPANMSAGYERFVSAWGMWLFVGVVLCGSLLLAGPVVQIQHVLLGDQFQMIVMRFVT